MELNNILEESERSRRALLSLLEDQKLIQENLRKSEKKYKSLYEHIPVMYFTVNSSGRILSANPYATEELGYSIEELTNNEIITLFFEEDKSLIVKQLEECFQNPETIFQWEVRKVHKNGGIIWVQETARIMEEPGGQVLLIACQNITDQKKLQITAEHQLHFANALNEIANVIISTENSSLILEKTTDIIGETLNIDRCLIYDLSFSNRTVAGLCEWLNPAQPDLTPTKATYPIEFFQGGATTMMETKRWLDSHYNNINPSLLSDGSGEVLHTKMNIKSLLWYPFSFRSDGFYLIVLNTTSVKKEWTTGEIDFLNSVSMQVSIALGKIHLLDERSRAVNALRESEEKYRFLADNTADTLALLDLDFNYNYISPSVFKQRGYTVEEAMIYNLDHHVTPESLKRAQALLAEELEIETRGTADPQRTRSIELEQYCKNGTTIWVDVSLSFVRNNNGIAEGIFAVSRDITERKKLAVEKERNNQVQEALNKILNITVEDISLEKSLQKILAAMTTLPFLSIEQKGAVLLADENQTMLMLTAFHNLEPQLQTVCLQVPFGICLCGKAAETKQLQFAACINAENEIKTCGTKPHGHYNVPILSTDKVLGVIVLYLDELHKQESYEKDFLLSVADILSGLIQRKKAELSLQESETRYRQLFENSPIGIYRTTPEGQILASNSALLKMLKYSSVEELQILNLEQKSYTSYSRELFKERLEREGSIVGLEVDWKRADGSLMTVRENATVVRDDSGKILYYDGTVEDITELKLNFAINASRLYLMQFAVTHSLDELLEETLNEAEKFTGSCVGFYHFVEDDQISVTLRNWSTRTKAEFSKLEGKGKRFKVRETGVWAECIHQKKPVIHNDFASLQHRSKMPEGHAELIRVLSVPVIRNAKVKAMLGVGNKSTDYTEKDIEAISLLADLAWEIVERKRVEEILRVSEERYRLIAENTADTISVFDMNLNFTYVSPSVIKLLGYTPDEFVNIKLEKIVTPNSWQLIQQLFAEELENEKSGKLDPNRSRVFITQQYRKDGSIIWVEGTASFVRDKSGIPLNILVTSKDICQRVFAEDALRKSEQKFRTLAENIPDNIVRYDLDGKAVYLNHEQEHKRYFDSTIIDKKPLEIQTASASLLEEFQTATSNSLEEYQQNLLRVLENGEEKVMELTIPDLSGNVHIHEVHFIAERNSENEIIGAMAIGRDITERKKSAQKIIDVQTMLRRVINLLPIRVFWKDRNLKYLGCNEIFAKDAGKINSDELIGNDDFQMGWKEQAEAYRADDQNIILSGLPKLNFEEPQTTPTGEKILLKTSKIPFTDSDGNIIGILGVYEDITDHKRMEESLKESEIRFRTLVEQSPFSTQIFDPEGNTKIVNTAFCKLWNVSASDLGIILMHYNILNDEQLEAVGLMAYIKKGFAGEFTQIPAIYYDPQKTSMVSGTTLVPKWVKGYIWPVLDDEGKVRQVVLMHEDITERKHSEEEVHKLSHAIQQSPVAVVITNLEGDIEYANPKASELSGYSLRELLGKNPRILSSGTKPIDEYEELWDTIISGKEWRGEFQNKKKSGELFWVSALISPIFSETGEIIRYLAVEEDISEKKKMIDELITAKDKAEEMNRLKSNFLSNMSHELRTPLNGILGYASILTSSLEDQEFTEMAQTIYTSGKRLSETLNLILDLSKAETEKLEVAGKIMDVASMVKSIINSFSADAERKNLVLESVTKAEEVHALLDENLFERAIGNLIRNAIKFTEKGKITVEVGKELYQRENWIYIKVKDTGIGIPEDKINLIWEEFRQASEGMARNFEGTGLGLTISKRIIEIMKGKVTVESKVGLGSIFTVMFPTSEYTLQFDEAPSTKTQLIQKPKETVNKVLVPKVVLYVEDDLINQNVVQLYLREVCRVETARDGQTALQMAAEMQYDLILMDINLGFGMDGLAVTKELRKMSRYAETPIVAVTAYAMESDKKEFLTGGCSHYLSKPFDKEELRDLVTSIVISEEMA